jgi:imidazole glycerol-phosphate synthase subunit HisH
VIQTSQAQPSIVIVDYGVGNTYSVSNAVQALGYKRLKISADEKEIMSADALVLPGVGAFATCAANLRERYLDVILQEAVHGKDKPILGICVGMQLMATESEENGIHLGLDWIPGRVVRLAPPDGKDVPHVGWNDVESSSSSQLFARTPDWTNFYFDHSYEYVCDAKSDIVAYCDYGKPIVAAISRRNIFGVQFHPEKSQMAGLKMFRSFFNMVASC